MRALRNVILLAAALLVAACAQHRPGTSEAAAESLAGRQAEFFAAQAARDADRMAALFTDDAVLQVANMPPVEGRAAIRHFYGNVFRFLAEARAMPQRTEVALSGDLAYSLGTTTNVFDGPEGLQEYAGKYTLVWQHIDGNWQIVVYSVSSDAR